MVLFSFWFEVHEFLDSKETFLRRSVARPFPRPSVELLSNPVAQPLRNVSLAGEFWQILAEQPAEVLVASALP
jgi:hypothetical protein